MSEFGFKVQEIPVFARNGGDKLIEDKKAIYRSDTDKVIAVVSQDYKVVSYEESVEAMEKGLTELGLKFEVGSTHVVKDGARMYRRYRFPDVKIKIGKLPSGEDDLSEMTLEHTNSYDGWRKLGFDIGGYRLVCSNGIRIGTKVFQMRRLHTKGLDLTALVAQMKKAIETFSVNLSQEWNKFREVVIGKDQGESILKELDGRLPKKYIEMAVKQWQETQEDRNLWTLYNNVTYVTTHQIEKVGRFELSRDLGIMAAESFRRKANELIGVN